MILRCFFALSLTYIYIYQIYAPPLLVQANATFSAKLSPSEVLLKPISRVMFQCVYHVVNSTPDCMLFCTRVPFPGQCSDQTKIHLTLQRRLTRSILFTSLIELAHLILMSICRNAISLSLYYFDCS